MSDIDLKNIPTLDDIIEHEDDKSAELKASDSEDADDEQADNNFDLFTNESDVDVLEGEVLSVDDTGIDNSAIDGIRVDETGHTDTTDLAETTELTTKSEATSTSEAITGDDIKQTDFAVDATPAADGVDTAYSPITTAEQLPEQLPEQASAIEAAEFESISTESTLIDDQSTETSSENNVAPVTEPLTQVSLDSMVNDVVKQLIPDLEQQLRFLVKQALEDKLPEDVIEKLSQHQD